VAQLAHVRSEDDVDQLRKDSDRCVAALRVVVEHAGVSMDGIELLSDWSNLVGGVGDAVIKLFAPFDEKYRITEQRALEFLEGKLGLATPKIRAQGELEGWSYLVMDRIPGQPLSVVWDLLAPDDRRRLCHDIGRTAARLHDLEVQDVIDLEPEWHAFIAEQRRGVLAQQARTNLESRWQLQIESYLDSVPLPEEAPKLLHTELAREHFFAEQRAGRWELSGLLDFEPAMMGHPEYEFASVGLFVSRGESELLQACLLGYGYDESDLGEELGRRFLAYALLHRYSSLAWYLKFMPTDGIETLDHLARSWWL